VTLTKSLASKPGKISVNVTEIKTALFLPLRDLSAAILSFIPFNINDSQELRCFGGSSGLCGFSQRHRIGDGNRVGNLGDVDQIPSEEFGQRHQNGVNGPGAGRARISENIDPDRAGSH
jgi:hypothetical protein